MPRKPGMTKAKAESKKAKPKVSAWFITINPHESANGLSEEELEATKEDYLQKVEGFFEKNWMDYVQFIDISDNSDHWNKVINVSNRVSVEVQKFNNARQIHTHNLFKITHRSKVILDYKTLKEDLKEFIDTKCPNSDNTHIKINRSTSSGENEKRYLEEKDGDEDDGFHWRVKPKEQSLPNGRKHHFITIVWVK